MICKDEIKTKPEINDSNILLCFLIIKSNNFVKINIPTIKPNEMENNIEKSKISIAYNIFWYKPKVNKQKEKLIPGSINANDNGNEIRNRLNELLISISINLRDNTITGNRTPIITETTPLSL